MRRNCRTYLTQISIRFASNYGRSAHTHCRKERAPEESTSHRATHHFIFLRHKTFVKKCHISACYVSSYVFVPKNLFENNITSLALPPRERTWGEQISPCYASFYFLREKNIFDEKSNLGVEAKKRKSCRTCLIQISLRFASKTSTLTTFSIVFGYRL